VLGLLVQFCESELGGAVIDHEEIQLAFSRLKLGCIKLEVALLRDAFGISQ
jgi:hypothetical protein